MATENPYPCPAPAVLANWCSQAAWLDSIDDHSRKLHEWSADTIRRLMQENARLAQRAEQLEAEAERYATLLYGGQKGGAA